MKIYIRLFRWWHWVDLDFIPRSYMGRPVDWWPSTLSFVSNYLGVPVSRIWITLLKKLLLKSLWMLLVVTFLLLVWPGVKLEIILVQPHLELITGIWAWICQLLFMIRHGIWQLAKNEKAVILSRFVHSHSCNPCFAVFFFLNSIKLTQKNHSFTMIHIPLLHTFGASISSTYCLVSFYGHQSYLVSVIPPPKSYG